jgi:Alpha/beta hydrolase domain
VRERETDLRTTPTDLSSNFDAPSRIAITRPTGFDAGAIYEFIYLARHPEVMGLGFATTRDIVSYLRRETADALGNANVLAGRIDIAIGFGLSQSGRYLHDFLYWGFNTDEAGRPVSEGLMPHIAVARKPLPIIVLANPAVLPISMGIQSIPVRSFRSPMR